jgi:hypothetical protein
MARRQSNESRVLQYFRTAPQAEMELVYGLVQGEVRARRGQGAPKPKKKTNNSVGMVQLTDASFRAKDADAQ